MRISLDLDLAALPSGLVHVRADFSGKGSVTALRLPVLLAKTGAAVEGLRAAGRDGKKLALKVSGERIAPGAANFTLEYSLRLTLRESVGTDKEAELLYPFLNESELFLGSGTLPYPEDLPRLAAGIRAELKMQRLPAGWSVFSSLPGGAMSPASLDSFFVYCSKGQSPSSHAYNGVAGKTVFRILVQKGKTIPSRPAELWELTDQVMGELEKNFSPYDRFRQVNVLILQPPADFEAVTNGRTFATGENMPGGIAVYTPKSPAYLKRLFGHGSYSYHLRDGLAHELTHFYFTTAWQGRFKSLLFPAAGCPARHKKLLGEVLTVYFHEAALRCHTGKSPSFISGKVLPLLASWKVKAGKKPVLDLFLLDLWLRSQGSTLKAAVAGLINEFGLNHKPYRSGAALLMEAERRAGIPPPPQLRKILLTPHIPDYAAELDRFPGWDRESFSPLRS